MSTVDTTCLPTETFYKQFVSASSSPSSNNGESSSNVSPSSRYNLRRLSVASSNSSEGKETTCNGPLNGEEAKTFYEVVVSSPSTIEKPKAQTRTNRTQLCKPKKLLLPSDKDRLSSSNHKTNGLLSPNSLMNVTRLKIEWMKYAQEDDIERFRALLEKYGQMLNVNMKDDFGWTALMCAACSGASKIVRFLLDNGANLHIRDFKGYSALDLARKNNHGHIIQILDAGSPKTRGTREALFTNDATSTDKVINGEDSSEQHNGFVCDICKVQILHSTKQKHNTSTLHVFNMNRNRDLPTFYGIPESNVGFKMMLKDGWNKELGLGPLGGGRKYPVKTVLKRDTKGLGFDRPLVQKVTHFKPFCLSAVKSPIRIREKSVKTPNKKELIRQQLKIKQEEINYRNEFK